MTTPCARLWSCRSPCLRGAVVEQQHGAVAADEELLQAEDLAAVAQRLARQQPHFRQRVEHHARRVDALDFGEHRLGGLAKLDLGRMEERVLVVRREARRRPRRQFVDRHAVERPAVRRRDRGELGRGLRQGDVQHFLAAPEPFEEKLQPSVVLPLPGSPSTR